jgi:hypothetical protein
MNTNRTCAVCEKTCKMDLCKKCYSQWVNKDGTKPGWLLMLISTQSSFDRNYASREEPFCDHFELNMDGDKEYDEDEYGDSVSIG